jgi:hypothetical protein
LTRLIASGGQGKKRAWRKKPGEKNHVPFFSTVKYPLWVHASAKPVFEKNVVDKDVLSLDFFSIYKRIHPGPPFSKLRILRYASCVIVNHPPQKISGPIFPESTVNLCLRRVRTFL